MKLNSIRIKDEHFEKHATTDEEIRLVAKLSVGKYHEMISKKPWSISASNQRSMVFGY